MQTTGAEDDIEMVYSATKANKLVVDDGLLDQSSIRCKKIMNRAKAIDNVSRVLFPFTFALYNVYYWTHYQTWLLVY